MNDTCPSGFPSVQDDVYKCLDPPQKGTKKIHIGEAAIRLIAFFSKEEEKKKSLNNH